MLVLFGVLACAGAEEYVLGPDSMRQPGVPQGKVTKYEWKSRIYPGTVRDYWVYVPAQYKGDRPARTMVFQDGSTFVNENGAFRAPIVFDNLIHKGELPVIVAIFINPGDPIPPCSISCAVTPARGASKSLSEPSS